ncbi:MAG: hypothetical protein FWD99_08145 [Oscillospiraceae bacterium]|nr:hypothetical protein [Oscillospiraceae bacterium]
MWELITLPFRLIFAILSGIIGVIGAILGVIGSVIGAIGTLIGVVFGLAALLLLPLLIYLIWRVVKQQQQ